MLTRLYAAAFAIITLKAISSGLWKKTRKTGGLVLARSRPSLRREDDEQPEKLPWAHSRRDLSQFQLNGLKQVAFEIMHDEEEDEPAPRFIIEYERKPAD